MTKTSLSFLEIYQHLEDNIINNITSAIDKDLLYSFNRLYNKKFNNIYQLSNFLWFDIGQFTPTKDVLGYKIGCKKDVNKAMKKLDSYVLSIIDL